MHRNPQALIIRKKTWDGYVVLTLKAPQVARRARPGQFLMVRVNDQPYPLLRRPLSIHARDQESVEIFFTRAGVGTTILAAKNPGEKLDILGPLGKGFALPKNLKGKTVCLVGGGRGIAPLFFLAQELCAKGVQPIIFYGGKTKADLPLLTKFGALRLAIFASTDDGSFGFHGLVSAMLAKELARWDSSPRSRAAHPAQIFACGPDPMMKVIAGLAADRGLAAQFSLESIMGCGIGACWGCVKKIKRGGSAEWIKICEEGPVFNASEIVWEEEDR